MREPLIYLASTIYKTNPDDCWEDELRSLLSIYEFNFFDPDPVENPMQYCVNRDKQEIQKCDIFVAYIQKPSFGVAMEILYAYEHDKPIIIINPNEKMMGNLWLEYHMDLMVASVKDAFEHITSMKFSK